jgi:hypothetical protein
MRPQRTPPLQSRFGRYGSQETLAIARSAPIPTVFVMGERGFSGSMVIGGGIRTSRPIQDPAHEFKTAVDGRTRHCEGVS